MKSSETRASKDARGRAKQPTQPASLTNLPIAAVLLVSIAVAYGQVRTFGFITLDDPQYVSANPIVRSGLTKAGLIWAFSIGTSFYWHPLTWLSHMLDVQLFGVDPGLHHLVSVALHAVNSVVLFAVMRKMTGAIGMSAFVAAVFAVHPLHVESVVWIAERKDVLSSFFWLTGMYAYALHAIDHRKHMLAATSLCFAAGLLAKPMVVTFPFALLLLDYWPLKRATFENEGKLSAWIPLIREKIPLFLLSGLSVGITLFSQRGSGAVIALAKLPLLERLANAVVSYAMYLRDIVLPIRLAPFYPLEVPAAWKVAVAIALLCLITIAALRFRRSNPWLLLGWLWFLGTLIPVIGLVQAGDQARADRFTYIPMLGIAIAITWQASYWLRDVSRDGFGRWAVRLTSIAIVVGLTVLTRAQAAFWKDDLTLWERTLTVTKRNYRIENLYGVALTDRGLISEGVAHYLKAIEIWPDNPEAHNNLGTARMDQQRIEDAVQEFSAAARMKPRAPTYHYNLGVALSAKGDTAGAVRHVREALNLDPANAQYIEALRVLGASVR